MDLRELLNVLARYRHRVVLLFFSAVVTAIAMTYVLSERFRSEALVLIRPQKTPAVVPTKEEMLDFPVSYFTPHAETTRTYSEMLKSQPIAERIVAELSADLLTPPQRPPGWRGLLIASKQAVKKVVTKTWALLLYGRIEREDPRAGAIKEIQKALTVKPTKETFLFQIQTEAKTPELAARIANSAARIFSEYLQERARNHDAKGRESREQAKARARDEFERLQNAVIEFKARTGVVWPKKETELGLEQLAELDGARVDFDKRIAGARARLADLETQLAGRTRFTRSQTKEADNPVFVNLQLELELKEVALVGLLKKFTPEHREVQVLQSQIEELKTRMAAQKPVRQSEETLAVDPAVEALSIEQTKCLTELEGLKAEQARVAAAQREKSRLLSELPAKEAELARLETAAELSQENYRLILKHLDELALATAMNIPAIEVVQDASAPVYPSRPIKLYHAILAGLLALLAGLGMALVSENLRQSARPTDGSCRSGPVAEQDKEATLNARSRGRLDLAAASGGNHSGELDCPGI